MVNDPLGAFTLTAHILGKDPSALPKDEYAEIEDFLTKMVAQAKTVSPGFPEMTKASSSTATSSPATRAGRTRTTWRQRPGTRP